MKMEMDVLTGNRSSNQPLEIDVRKILEQLGIQKEKWPEEFRKPVNQS